MILKRAVIFASLLAVSVIAFPLSAFGLAMIGIGYFGNFLFFWPQYMLLPYGFYDREIGHSEAYLMDSAILGAIVFWLIFALAFGYILRNFRLRYAVLATYPVAFAVMSLFAWALAQFGYGVYLDGP